MFLGPLKTYIIINFKTHKINQDTPKLTWRFILTINERLVLGSTLKQGLIFKHDSPISKYTLNHGWCFKYYKIKNHVLCFTFITEILHNVFSKLLFMCWYCGKGRLLQRSHGSFWRTFIGGSQILPLRTRVLIRGRHCPDEFQWDGDRGGVRAEDSNDQTVGCLGLKTQSFD